MILTFQALGNFVMRGSNVPVETLSAFSCVTVRTRLGRSTAVAEVTEAPLRTVPTETSRASANGLFVAFGGTDPKASTNWLNAAPVESPEKSSETSNC